MARSSARIRTTVVVVGIALLGTFSCGKKEPDRSTTGAPAKKHLILVGPTADHLSEDEYSVSMSDPREVIWLSIEKQKLGIRFPVDQPKLGAKAPKPFVDMTMQGDHWVFTHGCANGECFSGAINPDLKPPDGGLYYQYDQSLGDDTKDGWIVIKK